MKKTVRLSAIAVCLLRFFQIWESKVKRTSSLVGYRSSC